MTRYTEQRLAEADLAKEGFKRQRSQERGNPEYWLSEDGQEIAWVCRSETKPPFYYVTRVA